jgi:hypothetical protein
MKTFVLKFSAMAFILMLLTVTFTSTSCNKDKTNHGKVTVNDTTGAPIENATVKLAAPSVGGDVTYEGITDGSGQVSFEVKLPAIFDVVAKKGTLLGTAVLRLDEAGKTNEVTVVIR